MRYQHWIILICVCCFCFFQAFGQIHENSIPFSVTEKLPAITNFKEISSTDSLLCKDKKDSTLSLTKLFQFACPINTDLNPNNSGQWTETSSGRVWRLGIRSENAYSIYLALHYLLLPNTRLYFYSPGYENLLGAFTHRNNNPAQVLSISPVRGNKIIVELNVPAYQYSFGELKIVKVYHDYVNIFEESSFQALKSSTGEICNEDINCSNGKYWQTEKRSVCKIIYNGGMGTGTLIGNTGESNTPYLLTAYHVINLPDIAAEALFLFNYETTDCQKALTTKFQSLSGATILATTNHQIDFTLMKLFEKAPPSYQPFYAGWDAKNYISEKGVCIHHPFGNSKQIAIEYHAIESEDIGEGFNANSTWKVSHWELGTTELGSSGAPLFNEQHRIIGTLTGGRSTCGYPRDDYFTKFGISYETYPDSSNQLKYWLDPAQTGKLFLDGYDPYGFNNEYCDTGWNFFPYDRIGLSETGLEWGYVSGHNSAGYTQYAERFESEGNLQFAGVYLDVAKAVYSNPLAYIELKVWNGSSYPEKELYSGMLFLKDLQSNKVNYVSFDTVLSMTGSFFVGYKINYKEDSDTFALYHALDRGYTRPSSMYLYKDNWLQAEDPNALGIYTSLGIGISECYGKSRSPESNVLNVYPNPCINSLTLDLPERMPIHEVKCFDNFGRPVSVIFRQTEDYNRLFFSLKSGIYYLKIISKEKYFAARFIVL
jgi:lysyl endopeptidase